MGKFFRFKFLFLIFCCILNAQIFCLDEALADKIKIKTFDETEIDCVLRLPSSDTNFLVIFVNDYLQPKDEWFKLVDLMPGKYGFLLYNLRNFEDVKRENRKLVNSSENYNPNYFLQDLDRIIAFLDINYKIKDSNIILVGAKLGANVAINCAASKKKLKSVVLISPREEYKNISTNYSLKSYGDRPILLLTSAKDQESYDTCLNFVTFLSRNKNISLKFYSDKLEGTQFFSSKAATSDILQFLKTCEK